MPTILVIDDRADVRRAIEMILKARGYASRSAAGGEGALVLLRQMEFAAAVVDLFMPDLDGIATIQAMRRDFPAIPIIAISGHTVVTQSDAKPDFLKMAVKLGAQSALRKPFTPAQLINAVADAINSRRNEGAKVEPNRETLPFPCKPGHLAGSPQRQSEWTDHGSARQQF